VSTSHDAKRESEKKVSARQLAYRAQKKCGAYHNNQCGVLPYWGLLLANNHAGYRKRVE
jgi:hypothetical protein